MTAIVKIKEGTRDGVSVWWCLVNGHRIASVSNREKAVQVAAYLGDVPIEKVEIIPRTGQA